MPKSLSHLGLKVHLVGLFFIQVGNHTTLILERPRRSRESKPWSGWEIIIPVPWLISKMLSNKRDNSVKCTICLPIDMTNRHHHKWPKGLLDIMKERVDLALLRPVLNPSNNNGRISLNENPLNMQLLASLGDAYPCSSELSFWNQRLMKKEATSR